jgi:hypothetical protein
MEIDKTVLETIEASAYKGFSVKEVAYIIGMPPKDFELKFADDNDACVISFRKGLYQSISDLREQIMQSALSGSSPAQAEMIKILKESVNELNFLTNGR